MSFMSEFKAGVQSKQAELAAAEAERVVVPPTAAMIRRRRVVLMLGAIGGAAFLISAGTRERSPAPRAVSPVATPAQKVDANCVPYAQHRQMIIEGKRQGLSAVDAQARALAREIFMDRPPCSDWDGKDD